MQFENLTPHTVYVEVAGQRIAFPASGTVARVKTNRVEEGELPIYVQTDHVGDPHYLDAPVTRIEKGEPENLPEPREGVVLIVSMMVAQALPDRADVVAPDTDPKSVIRDTDGNIAAVRGFARYPKTPEMSGTFVPKQGEALKEGA